MPRRTHNKSKVRAWFTPALFLLLALVAAGGGCSLLNRNGPDVTCRDLSDGAINACADGIIASCANGQDVTFEVCNEAVDGTDPDALCEASWQLEGAYRCGHDGTGGNGGSGGGVGPTKIEIASIVVMDDSNSDGYISPGEDVTLHLTAKNTGADPAKGVTASLTSWDSRIALSSCTASGTYGNPQTCTSTCDCTNVSDSSKQDISGGQEASYAALKIEFRVAKDAALTPLLFEVEFEDSLGRTWLESFEVEVVATGANLQVASAVLSDDSNHDGKLTPGETATVKIYAENAGSSQVLGLFASLSAWDENVILSSCVSHGTYGNPQTCTSTCECGTVSDSSKQDISPAQTGSYSLLEVEFVLTKTAPTTPIVFDLVFEDEWGNTWTDSVTLEVVPTGAVITIDSTTLVSDSNSNGVLQPGETATVRIKAANTGTSEVLDLVAIATTTNGNVNMSSCVAKGTFGNPQTCTPVCDCSNVSSSSKQDISPAQTASYGILEITFTLSGGAPSGTPISFNVTFKDAWDNTWSRSFQIPVSP